jgi:hypothetical protein
MAPGTFNNNALAAKLSVITAWMAIAALLALHFASPEFSPAWRMVSEYANGKFEWLLVIFFISWGLSTWFAAWFLWFYTTSVPAKAGVVLLVVSGAGEIMAAFFNVNHPMHGNAGTLGIPTFIIAALLISYHLKKKEEWKENKATLLWAAHATWISLLLIVVTMIVMIAGFKNAGFAIGPGQKPPLALPNGVTGLVGYANRILIIAYLFWLLFVANNYLKIFKTKVAVL